LVSNLIVILGAGIVGWFLAGEPTNVKDLKKGISKLMGATGASDGGGGYGGGMYPGYPPGGPSNSSSSGPPSTDPSVQALQQQMQQMTQQSQMEKQQQQFADQLSQQQQAAQMSQMQQQMQASQVAQQQAAAAAAAGGLGGAGASSGQPMGMSTGATAPPGTVDPLSQTTGALPTSSAEAAQQMLPSATAPGVVPGQQPGQGQSPYNPYGGITSGVGNIPGSYPGLDPSAQFGGYGLNPLGVTGNSAIQLPGGGGYPDGTGGFGGGFGFGGLDPINQSFASGFDPVARPVGVQPPLAALPNSGVGNLHSSFDNRHTRTHHGFLGIIDHDTIDHGRPTPFFSGYPELMRIDLGSIVPGLGGATVGDLIIFTDSGTGNEIFVSGIDRFDYGAFTADITRYVHRILRNMGARSPADRIRVLRELLIEVGTSRGLTFLNPVPPNVVTYQNVLSTVPRRHFPDTHPIHRGRGHPHRDGISLPDKFAVLQFKGSNSMPPMVHAVRGQKPGKSLFFK
jgi:hypothetical protein